MMVITSCISLTYWKEAILIKVLQVENNCLYVNEIAQEEEDFIAEPPNYTLGSTVWSLSVITVFSFYWQSFQNFAMLAVPRAEVVINHKEGQVAD